MCQSIVIFWSGQKKKYFCIFKFFCVVYARAPVPVIGSGFPAFCHAFAICLCINKSYTDMC